MTSLQPKNATDESAPTVVQSPAPILGEDAILPEHGTISENLGRTFLEAVRQLDRQLISRTAKDILSNHAVFSSAVPQLTLGILDEHPLVREQATFLLAMGIDWANCEDLNDWILPTVIKAFDTLQIDGPILRLCHSLSFLAHDISQNNLDSYAEMMVRLMDPSDTFSEMSFRRNDMSSSLPPMGSLRDPDMESMRGLILLAPFSDRLEPEILKKAFSSLVALLVVRTKELLAEDVENDLGDKDHMRKWLPVIAISILNLERHVVIGSADSCHTIRKSLKVSLSPVVTNYSSAALSRIESANGDVSAEDRAVLFAIATVFGSDFKFRAIFTQLEKCLKDRTDGFGAALGGLASNGKVSDPYTVLLQARNMLQQAVDIYSVISTIESACISLHHGLRLSERQLYNCAEILRDIQRLTTSRFLGFCVRRALEAFDSNSE